MTIEKGTRVFIEKDNCYGQVEMILEDENNKEIILVFCVQTPSHFKKYKREELSEFE